MRLSGRRQVAIYLRGGRLWIADFIDGHGKLVEPEVWFRFNCASAGARHAKRRMLLESGLPLPADTVAKIEELHRGIADPKLDHSREDAS